MADSANSPGGDPASAAAADFAKAAEALAPAFALALAKAAEVPERWAELSRAFLASAGRQRPDEILDTLFGGAAFREAVARQAAAMSGVAQQAVAAAMPQLAALGAETMMRAATGGNPAALGTPLATDAFGPFAAEVMRRGANAVEAFSRPSAAAQPGRSGAAAGAGFSNPFLDAFASAIGPATGLVPPALPFAALFDAFAAGLRPPFPPPSQTVGANASPPASPFDLLDAFARSGQRFREDYAKGMAALFERFPAAGGPAG